MNTLPTTPSEPMAAIDAGGGYPDFPEWIALNSQHLTREMLNSIKDTMRAYADATAALRAGQVAAQPSDEELDAEWHRHMMVNRFLTQQAPRDFARAILARFATPSPVAPVQAAQADDVSTDQLIELTAHLERVRAQAIVKSVEQIAAEHDPHTMNPHWSGWSSACEEIALRLKTEAWGMLPNGGWGPTGAANEDDRPSPEFPELFRRALSAPPIESKGVRILPDTAAVRLVRTMLTHAGDFSLTSEDMLEAMRVVAAPAAPITAVSAGEGWKLVPVMPTEEMETAGIDCAPMFKCEDQWKRVAMVSLSNEECAEIYRAMLAAASVPGVVQPPADAVDGPMKKSPDVGDSYWYINAGINRVLRAPWCGDDLDRKRLRESRVFRTQADARAAMPLSQPASDAGEQA